MSRLVAQALTIILVAALAVLGGTPGFAAPKSAVGQTILILDASNSMWGQIRGNNKIVIARKAVGGVLNGLPRGARLGIMAYGHRSRNSCTDIGMIVPLGRLNAKTAGKTVLELTPRGKTPIAAALGQAAKALGGKGGTIILLSDGLDNCQGDPCAAAKKLARGKNAPVIHVIGFDVSKKSAPGLRCISKAARGRYLPAQSGKELTTALKTAFSGVQTAPPAREARVLVLPAPKPKEMAAPSKTAPPPPPEPVKKAAPPPPRPKGPQGVRLTAMLSAGGAPLEKDTKWYIYEAEKDPNGQRKELLRSADPRPVIELAAGRYYVAARHGLSEAAAEITVKPGTLTDSVMILDAGTLRVSAPGSGAGKTALSGRAVISLHEDIEDSAGRRPELARSTGPTAVFHVPAGKWRLRARRGYAASEKTVDLAPGQIRDVVLPMRTGELRVAAIASAGSKPMEGVSFTVFGLDPGRTGALEEIARLTSNHLDLHLPEGRYKIVARLGKAQASTEMTVTADKITSQNINMKAGWLKLSARLSGADKPLRRGVYFTVHAGGDGGKKGPEVYSTPRSGGRIALNAGTYRIVSRLGSVNSVEEERVTVEAGKTTQALVEHDAGRVTCTLVDKPGGKPRTKVYWILRTPLGKEVARSARSSPVFDLRSGDYRLAVRYAGEEQILAFVVKPGEEKNLEITAKKALPVKPKE